MNIKILTVGRMNKDFLRKGETEYIKRISSYSSVTIDEVKDVKIKKNYSREQIIHTEGERLIKKIPNRSWIVSLDENGRKFTSVEFAKCVSGYMSKGVANIVFLIGGPLGLSKNVKKISHQVLSLSKMTFTHEMVRLILLEQIYRSFTIIKGGKYHK